MDNDNINLYSPIYNLLKTTLTFIFSTLIITVLIHLSNHNLNVPIYYILVVVMVSILTTSYVWGIITAITATIATYFLFTFPYSTLSLRKSISPINFFSFFLVSVIISVVTSYIMSKVRHAGEKQERTNKLNEINNKLLVTNGLDNIIELILKYAVEFSRKTVVIYPDNPQTGNNGIIKTKNNDHLKILNSYHEQFITNWVFINKSPAGVGTDYSPKASCIYLPLLSHNHVWGVLGIYCINQKPLDHDVLTYLNLMLSPAAMALERQHLSDNQQLMNLETEKEKMRGNLLRAVSHDLRTPLTGMIGASATLIENKKQLTKKEKDKLIRNIHEDSTWLLHMVENLLSVTRINEESSSVNKVPEPLEEVVSEAIMRLKKRYPDALVNVKVPLEFLMVPMDATLIEQVIINLVENAIKYSGSENPVEILVEKNEDYVLFHIYDYGIGIAEDKLETIFDGYVHHDRNSVDAVKGFGIGLSICKTIVNAHGGNILAQNHKEGGALFTFSLPLDGGIQYES